MRFGRRAAARVSLRCASVAAWASRWSSRLRLPEVRIDREALTAIVAHAYRDAPNECCGLLVGRGPAKAGPYGFQILEAVPTSNGASDPTKRTGTLPAHA